MSNEQQRNTIIQVLLADYGYKLKDIRGQRPGKEEGEARDLVIYTLFLLTTADADQIADLVDIHFTNVYRANQRHLSRITTNKILDQHYGALLTTVERRFFDAHKTASRGTRSPGRELPEYADHDKF